jgi:hypothetical protein
VFVATALLLVFLLGSPGGNPARVAQAASVSITYAAKTQASLTLCVGESDEVAVRVLRVLRRPGREVGLWVPGGRVVGVSGNANVVHFEPSDAGRDVVGQPIPEAVFKVVADTPGQTEIEFVIKNTGEEASVGSGWPQSAATVRVEVNDCYEAHTSALAAIFTTKDMGGLNKHFLLSGYTPNTHGVTTDTQVMFFIPSPQDRLRGGFAWVDLATTILGGLQGSCIAYFSGRYEVVFYIPPNDPAPPGADVGDLMMYGQGDVFCNGKFVLHLDYRQSAGFQISFKPKPRP